MAEQSMIIIGGGLAGLSTGCYARMNGFKTRIFESHASPGGLCTAWKRKGYTLDGCIHWLMSCKEGTAFRQIYDELGAFTGNRLMFLNEYCRFRDLAGGQSLVVSADLQRLAADMKSLAPEDAEAIGEFIDCCQATRGIDTGFPEPREVTGPLGRLKMMWQVRGLVKYVLKYSMSVSEFARRFKNPFLRRCVTNLFVPEMPAYFLFVVLGQLADGQLGLVEGSSQRFSDAIDRRYQELGGKITYSARVEQVLVENNRATGVQLADGSRHRADLVVSAADGYSTIYQMLGGKYINEDIRKQYDTWPLFSPIMLISYGVARRFPGEAASNVITLKSPLAVSGKEVNDFFVRIFNYDPTLAPPGKTVVQVMFEADYDYWCGLRADHDLYQAEKSKAAEAVLTGLEEIYPGFTGQVEMIDVATPYTFWRYTGNHRGSYEGWLMTTEAVHATVPKTLPGLKNFYMAGQWVEPGGGIPPALYSGRNLVKILCKQEGKKFTTTFA